MAPKRKCSEDEVDIEPEKAGPKPKILMFGFSPLRQSDIESLVSGKMVLPGKVRAPEEGKSKLQPKPNEVVIYRDQLFSGLRFPLDPVVIEILKEYGVFLHQLTPNGLGRLTVCMWVCKTTKIKPFVAIFMYAHQIHKQMKVLPYVHKNKGQVEKECQFGCLNFTYKPHVCAPVGVYRNKWPNNWWEFWLYHEVDIDASGHSPLVRSPLEHLPSSWPASNEIVPEGVAFVDILREIAREYSFRDLYEEFCICRVYPLRSGWNVTHWKDVPNKTILMPDFQKSFGISKKDVDPVWAEEQVNFMIGKESPPEFKENKKMLGLKRSNRVFEFFGIEASLRKATAKSLAKVEKDLATMRAKISSVRIPNVLKPSDSGKAMVAGVSEVKFPVPSAATKRLESHKRKTCSEGASKKTKILDPKDVIKQMFGGDVNDLTEAGEQSLHAPEQEAASQEAGAGTSGVAAPLKAADASEVDIAVVYSPLAAKSDEEWGEVRAEESAKVVPAEDTPTAPSSPQKSSSSGSSGSSTSSSDDSLVSTSPLTSRPLLAAVDEDEDADANIDKTENSCSYFVSTEDPRKVADRLGASSKAKLIGGQVIGKENFRSGGHELKFLSEAGRSFCLPLIEDQLCKEGTEAFCSTPKIFL
ncbi:unnamed protein product [Urochloa humidicola]